MCCHCILSGSKIADRVLTLSGRTKLYLLLLVIPALVVVFAPLLVGRGRLLDGLDLFVVIVVVVPAVVAPTVVVGGSALL